MSGKKRHKNKIVYVEITKEKAMRLGQELQAYMKKMKKEKRW